METPVKKFSIYLLFLFRLFDLEQTTRVITIEIYKHRDFHTRFSDVYVSLWSVEPLRGKVADSKNLQRGRRRLL